MPTTLPRPVSPSSPTTGTASGSTRCWLASLPSSRAAPASLIRVGATSESIPSGRDRGERVRSGQRIAVILRPTAESRAFAAEPLPITVVHEDAHLFVVENAAGMVVHPAAGNWSGTLLNALLARDPASAALPRAGIVAPARQGHLGLMSSGRTLAAVTSLTRAIARAKSPLLLRDRARDVRPKRRFESDAPIGRDPRQRTRMAVVGIATAASRREPISRCSRWCRTCRAAMHAAQRSNPSDSRPPRIARHAVVPTRCMACAPRSACRGRRCMPPRCDSRTRSPARRWPSHRSCRQTWRRPGHG